MAADNQVILEGIAKMGSLLRDIHRAVASSEAELNKLGEDHPIVVSVAKAQADLDRTIVKLRGLATQADRPAVVRIRTEEAERGVASLVAQVRAVGTAFDQFGPADPFGPFRQAANTAARAVEDLSSRTTAGSKNFGQSLDRAATQAKIALEGLQREIRDTAAAGAPVPPAVVAQVDRLETEYRQATVAAHNFRVAQAGVRAEIRSSKPPIDELNASLGRAAIAVKAFIAARAIQELKDLGQASFNASERLKAINRQFESVFGEGAEEEIAFVRRETERLGLELGTAADDYIKLANAAQNSELKGQGVRRLFTQLSEGAIVSRLSANDFSLVLRAFSQILGGTTFRMEELTTQLRDSLPQSYGIALEAVKRLSIGNDDFREAARDGLLGSAEFAREFANVWQEQIGGKVPEASKSATAELGRFNTKVFEAEAAAGDKFSPAVADLTKQLGQLLVDGRPVIEFLGTFASVLAKAASAQLILASGAKDALVSLAALVQGVGAALTPGGAGLGDYLNIVGERAASAEDKLKQLLDLFRDTEPAADAAADGLAGLADGAGNTGNAFGLAQRKIRAALLEIDKMAKALPESGEVHRKVADQIVKAIDKQIIAIKSLPVAEREVFAERLAGLESLRNRLEQFTTAYIKEQERQAEAAERLAIREAAALDRRAEKIKQFFDSARRSAGERADTLDAGASDDLLKAREELAGLEGKALLDTEDIQRIDALRESIEQLEGESQRAGATVRQVAQAAAASSEDIANDLRELQEFVSGPDFRAAFLELPADISAAVEETVSGYERMVAAQGATAEGAEQFRQTLITLFQGGAEAADQFAAQLQGAGVTAGGVGAAFDQMRASVEGSGAALAKTGSDADTAATGIKAANEAIQETLGFAPRVVKDVRAVGESFLRASDDAAVLDGAAGHLVESLVAVIDTSNRTSDGVLRAGDTITRFGEKASEAGGTITTAAGDVIKLKGAGEEAGEGLDTGAAGAGNLATEAGKAATSAQEAADGLTKAAAAARDAAPAVQDAATGLANTGAAAKESAEPIGLVASHLKEVRDADPAKTFGDAADQTARAASASKDLATGLGNVVKAVTEGEDELHALATRGGEIAEGFEKADTALSGFNERAGIAIGLCKDLHECLAGLASA